MGFPRLSNIFSRTRSRPNDGVNSSALVPRGVPAGRFLAKRTTGHRRRRPVNHHPRRQGSLTKLNERNSSFCTASSSTFLSSASSTLGPLPEDESVFQLSSTMDDNDHEETSESQFLSHNNNVGPQEATALSVLKRVRFSDEVTVMPRVDAVPDGDEGLWYSPSALRRFSREATRQAMTLLREATGENARAMSPRTPHGVAVTLQSAFQGFGMARDNDKDVLRVVQSHSLYLDPTVVGLEAIVIDMAFGSELKRQREMLWQQIRQIQQQFQHQHTQRHEQPSSKASQRASPQRHQSRPQRRHEQQRHRQERDTSSSTAERIAALLQTDANRRQAFWFALYVACVAEESSLVLSP